MKVIIIGGGASGIMHALYLRKLNKDIEIQVLEKNDRILKKLMKTGNGKCNISNLDMNPSYYNKFDFIDRLYKKILPQDVLDYFKSIGLLLKNDSSTRLYPYSESAKTVIDTLRYELDKSNIEIIREEEVIEIIKTNKFKIKTKINTYISDYVVVAAGSIAQETTDIYNVMKNLNYKITNLESGLVALKVKEDLKSLQGIRIKCRASVVNNKKITYSEDGELLFKEQGISGVLVLNLSRYVDKTSIIRIDLFYDYEDINNYILSFLNEKSILDILSSLLPKMLAIYIVKICNNNVNEILETIHNLEFNVNGNYGYSQGQIVLGGVDISEINDDFSSKSNNELYIIGELLDIDGASGGYNLHFAWTSGIVSAISIFEKNL